MLEADNRRVRISDLADALGVTKSTVSRALNGYPDIAQTTQAKVRAMARDMGYSPMSSAQAIRTGRVRALGLVLELDAHDQHSPFLTEFLAGVTQAASEEGWSVTVATARYGPDINRTYEQLINDRKADGFIVPRTRAADDRVAHLRRLGAKYILYGRTGFGETETPPSYSYFDINGEQAMFDAVVRLARSGHARIGYVGSSTDFNFARLRIDGYQRGLAAMQIPFDPSLVRQDVMTPPAGTDAVSSLLHLEEPPTAIVCDTDEVALGGYEAVNALGLRIGQEVSFISYDGVPRGAYASPPLTTFGVDSQNAGARLASLLIQQLRGKAPETLCESASAHLRRGGSDGPPTLTSNALASFISERSKNSHWEEKR